MSLLAPIRKVPVRIDWLDWDENVVGQYTGYALSGSITFDAGQDVRRSFTMTMENSSKLFIPNQSIVNQQAKVRIRRGVKTSGSTSYYSRGVYVLTDPSAVNRGSERTVTLNGLSKWALFDGTLGGKITETVTIPQGTNVAEAIKSILKLRNETKFNFDETDVVTPYEMTKEPGSTLAEFLKELALIPSWELFDAVDGYWRFRPMVDAAQKPIVADFSKSGTYRPLYISGSYDPKWSNIINKVKVVGYTDPDTGVTYSGTYELPSTHHYSSTNIGERADIRQHPELTTNELCVTRAEYEVHQRLKEIDCSSHQLIFIPFLTELDCVEIETDEISGKHEIQRITENIANSEQSIEAWKVVEWT